MFKHKRTLILMAALGALSAGGSIATASDASAPSFPDDGQIRFVHGATEQVCVFATPEEAQNFIDNVEDRANWNYVYKGEPLAAASLDTSLSGLVGTTSDAPVLTDVVQTPVSGETNPAASEPSPGAEAPAPEAAVQ